MGVNGEPISGLADFYRKIWKQGEAGVVVPLDILADNGVKRVDIKSINRNDHLRLKSTF
jgi:S1-C subfamily serine protease